MSSLRSAALLLLVLVLTGSASADDYAKLPFGNAYPLTPTKDGRLGARIPIEVTADVSVKITDVAAATTREPAWTKCITAEREQNANATPAIVVYACPEVPPGVYAVTLSITPAAPAATAATPQKLLVQLTRSAAELRPLTTQTVDQVVSLIRPVSMAPASLILVETTGRGRLTGVTATRVEAMTLDDRRIAATIKFCPPATLENGRAELPFRLEGDFPYGTAKTLVQVHANELAAPLYVAYEIRTRLHGWLLLPAILLGLLLGYLTRVLLKTFIDKRRVRVAALDLLDRMATERKRRRDKTFVNAVNALEQRLTDELTRKTLTAESVKAVDNDFAQKLTDLQQRVADVRKAVNDAAAVAKRPDDYPPAIAAALLKAQAAFSGAMTLAESGDATAAQTALDAANADVARDVDAAANAWRIDVKNALATELPPLPKRFADAFSDSKKAITDGLASVPVGQQKRAAEILEKVFPVAFLVKNQVRELLAPLADYAQRVIDVLASNNRSAANAVAALAESRKANAADPDVTLAKPLAAVPVLLEALRKDIAAVAEAQQNDVTALLDAGDYLQAARDAEQGHMQGGAADDGVAVPGGTPASAAPPLFTPLVVVPQSAQPYDHLLIARARGIREIAAAELAQFVIAAIGIALVGLLFLLPAFDGTWRGLLTALFWGYAGDISIDALTEGAKKQAPKT